MNTGAGREERRQQRDILKELYPDYNPVRHDVYVIRYNKEQDAAALKEYMIRRGVIPRDTNQGAAQPNGEQHASTQPPQQDASN